MSKTAPEYFTEGKFELGRIVATQHIMGQHFALALNNKDPELWSNFYRYCLYSRHWQGDWGDLCDEDKQANEDGLLNGGRLFSSYDISEELKKKLRTHEEKIWIITESDRSCTTILFPSDY